MTADPLADVLRRVDDESVESGDFILESAYEAMARAAREHIAAEIEAETGPPMLARDQPWHNGMLYAANVARGGTP